MMSLPKAKSLQPQWPELDLLALAVIRRKDLKARLQVCHSHCRSESQYWNIPQRDSVITSRNANTQSPPTSSADSSGSWHCQSKPSHPQHPSTTPADSTGEEEEMLSALLLWECWQMCWVWHTSIKSRKAKVVEISIVPSEIALVLNLQKSMTLLSQ